jgi:hypothetical protein
METLVMVMAVAVAVQVVRHHQLHQEIEVQG